MYPITKISDDHNGDSDIIIQKEYYQFVCLETP